MTGQSKFKCMRCGHEWPVPPLSDPDVEERACPRCRSNSVRLIKAPSGG